MPRSNEDTPEDGKEHGKMNRKKPDETKHEQRADASGAAVSLSCDDVLDRLDLYLDTLDGTDGADEGLPALSAEERTAVEVHVTRCPACAQELSRARWVRDGLRALPEVPYTPKAPAEREAPARILPGPWLRWAVPLAAAAVLVVAVLIAGPGRAPEPAPEGPTTAAVEDRPQSAALDISPAELARAELEARYALARLAEATRRARREIREDVLARHVVAPVQRELLRSFHAPPEIDPEAAGRKPASL